MDNWYRQFIEMVLVDLDGTLLNADHKIGNKDFQSLQLLGEAGIIRVFATGRNLYSAHQVLSVDCPFDYLVFSSGAGIMDWKTQEILLSNSLSNKEVLGIEKFLKDSGFNFSIHFPIPDNHKYYFHKSNTLVQDFDFRNLLYRDFNYSLNGSYPIERASQFLIILNHETEIESITSQIDGFKIIRATSPIDGKSVWLEIFNKNVSKASGGKFLCDMLDIPYTKTLGIGNDYNDLDLLDWASYSFMVSNAPESIKSKYSQCADNRSNPLSDVLFRLQKGII
jgi:Cof subfamily protein (haloacid dehalogenase superfamily)